MPLEPVHACTDVYSLQLPLNSRGEEINESVIIDCSRCSTIQIICTRTVFELKKTGTGSDSLNRQSIQSVGLMPLKSSVSTMESKLNYLLRRTRFSCELRLVSKIQWGPSNVQVCSLLLVTEPPTVL